MATYWAASAGSILAANAWESVQGGGGDTTFSDGNAAGHTLDLDGLAMTSPNGTTLTCTLLQAATGTLTPTGTLVITGKVKYTGTSTSGMIIVGSSAALTVQPGTGAGTNAVENTSTGYVIVVTGDGVYNITNSGGTAILNATGRGVSSVSTGTCTVTGAVSCTNYGISLYHATGAGTLTLTGDVSATGTTSAVNWGATSSTFNFVGKPLGNATNGGNCPVSFGGGTCNWTGTVAIAANEDVGFNQTGGTCNYGTGAGTKLILNNTNGRCLIRKIGGTGTTTYLEMNNLASNSQSMFWGHATSSFVVTGPSIPSSANVRYGVARGFPSDSGAAVTGLGDTAGTLQIPNSDSPTGVEDETSDACVVSGKKYGSTPRTGSAAGGGGVIVIED